MRSYSLRLMWPPISRDDLKVAAKRAGFDLQLPVLVRRLIAETANGLIELEMPGESGVAVRGFDGITRTTGTSTFVPDGVSVWELSVGGNDAKADDDFAKRAQGPPGHWARDCTYVEVILVPWTKARQWAAGKSRLRRWRSVRAYNLDHVHAWLESAPATTAWLADQLGKTMPGVRAIDEWWQDTWLPSAEPVLGAAIVLAGREKSVTAFTESLLSGEPSVALGGNLRLDEAMAFIAASLGEADQPAAAQLLARTLVVSDSTSLQQLAAQSSPLILVLPDATLARDLPTRHPHQLVTLAAPWDESAIPVERLDSRVVSGALGQSDPSGELGHLARRSLLALRRRLAVNPSVLTPSWAVAPSRRTRRFLLLGAWRSENEVDRTVVEKLVGVKYPTALAKAESLQQGSDFPFLDHIDDEWFVVAREDAWTLVSPAVDADDIRALRTTAVDVLSTADPTLEIDPEDRWMAGLRGTRPPHSAPLRRGLAETIALMGGSDQLAAGASSRLVDYARATAREIFDRANADHTYALWSSLTDVLQLLAEGAPSEFLSAMRKGLKGATPLHAKMFRDSKSDAGFFGPSSPHTEFLWALESLAWSPDHIDEVVQVLIALDALDPGGRLANRPRASLLGILSVWNPQTSASLEDRLRSIRLVAGRARFGFEILLDLIPDSHPVQMQHSTPRFKDWKPPAPLTWPDVRATIQEVASIILQEFELTAAHATALVARLDRFDAQFRAGFAAKAAKALGGWDADQRDAVFEALREFVSHHQEHSSASWALAPDELRTIVELRDLCEPDEPSRKYRWLFKQSWVTLGDFPRANDYRAFEAELLRRRRAAIQELMAADGLEGVLNFAASVDAWVVGSSLEATGADVRDAVIVHALSGGPPAAVAAGFLAAHLRGPRSPDLDELLAQHSNPQLQAFILRYVADPRIAIEALLQLSESVAEVYWKSFSYFGLGTDFGLAEVAGWHLVVAGRPAAALKLNLLYMRDEPTDLTRAQLFVAALEAILHGAAVEDRETSDLDVHDMERVFGVLAQHREELGPQRVLALEWQLMPISLIDEVSLSLHTELKTNPGFFVELVVAGFRSASEVEAVERSTEEESRDHTERRRSTAARAWEVLKSCKEVPGVSTNGDLEIEVLRDWIIEARRGLATADRSEIGDIQIGELLSRAPRNADGSPIPSRLRDLLEDLASDEIMRGISLGIFNSRGLTSRDPEDGGSQELVIAETYQRYADAARPWPLTRKLFIELAESYRHDARREESSAERLRQGRY